MRRRARRIFFTRPTRTVLPSVRSVETSPQTLADRRLAFRVGKDAPWTIVAVDSSCSVAVEIESCLERPAVDACVTYANEQVFEALMDEKYSSAVAVATRRLRISGSMSIAQESEPLFDAVEAKLRATRAVAVGGAEAAAARRAAAEATLDARLRDAAARPWFERWRARHVGTDQQVAVRVNQSIFASTARIHNSDPRVGRQRAARARRCPVRDLLLRGGRCGGRD